MQCSLLHSSNVQCSSTASVPSDQCSGMRIVLQVNFSSCTDKFTCNSSNMQLNPHLVLVVWLVG
jgi:hypothetical protein